MYRTHLEQNNSKRKNLLGHYHYWFSNRYYFFCFECYYLWLSDFSTDFFDAILYLKLYALSFFHCVGECFVCSKNSAVITLINQLHTDAVIKRCSNKKLWEAYLEPKRISTMELFSEIVNAYHFRKKAPS